MLNEKDAKELKPGEIEKPKKQVDLEKDLFCNFEIIEVTGQPINFKGQRSSFLSFTINAHLVPFRCKVKLNDR